ncbi:E3 ubiquitin-protein ligase NRDP1-like [Teleopsis dalmanni]|uniref:E3 ubiquitin-protein ligase NRDP1-like n=1 Tax=Teleopsis dalmanni TaxID=139649 RepID=UPI0018CD76E3|nr:E3 ubiquitin-protein ligase NRDP1-like [Teleopsis dalmanni]
MGYDVHRFIGGVDEELICPICSGVLEDPIQIASCEHSFCRQCITQWITRQSTCPIDRSTIETTHIREVPRIFKTLLSRLRLSCTNVAEGCTVILKLEDLGAHRSQCEYNPNVLLTCEKGCGMFIPKDQMKDHNCIRELSKASKSLKRKIFDLEANLQYSKQTILELKADSELFKRFIRTTSFLNPEARAIAIQIDENEVVRWSRSLHHAEVANWLSIISTPNRVLKSMIKNCLSEMNCPPHILNRLATNCHERHWPRGICTPTIRRFNRQIFDRYVCKQIRDGPSILILSCDNNDIEQDFMVEPGFIMIFADDIN